MENNTIYIERIDKEKYRFCWIYDKKMTLIIKEHDKGQFEYKIVDGIKYIYVEGNQVAKQLTDLFINFGKYQPLYKDSYKETAAVVNEKSEVFEKIDYTEEELVSVQRNNNYTDKLSFFIPKSLNNMFSAFPFAKRVGRGTEWVIPIDKVLYVYEEIRKLQKQYIFRGIGEWIRIVNEWKADYGPTMINCSNFKPYPFQLKDTDEMLKKHKCILANDMGCGKTHEAVRVGSSLPMAKLIICPATLRINWKKEILMVNPNAEYEIIYSNSKDIKLKEWNIIGFDSVNKHLKLLEDAHFQCIFIDEAHMCQAISNYGTPNSKRAEGVLRLTAMAGWVYPITGTPETSRNIDLYNILKMINHPLTQKENAFYSYGMKYCDGKKNSVGKMDYTGNSNSSELHILIKSYMIRHLKSEVLPHLKKQRQAIPLNVNLDGYNKALNSYKNGFKKLSQDALLALLVKGRMSLATEKVKDTIELAESIIKSGNQVVISTCFTEVVEKIEKHFKDNCVKVVGGMGDKKKEEAKERFQNKEIDVIILNIDAGGVGITLTAAHYMIINDLPWTTGQLVQVEDRICRSGQTEEYCIIYYMMAVSAFAEEKMIQCLTEKSDNFNTVIDGGKGEVIDFIDLIRKSIEK